MVWRRVVIALLLTGLVVAQAPQELNGPRGGTRPVSGVRLSGTKKVSPAFHGKPANRIFFAVVKFYADVDMGQARTVLTRLNLEIRENPDLLPNDLLVSGTAGELGSLAEWDEVEYIYPASNDLVSGRSIHACPGAISDHPQLGQSILKVGGWGAPGDSANLQYAFVNSSEKLDAGLAKSEIVRALTTWSKCIQVNWTESSDTNANRTVAILFASGDHGDGYPFSGSGVVAHTFYPYPVNSEPLAGNMHFNEDENWHIGADVDLFSVALHEAGHALGLGHSDVPGAVMYPYYHEATDLSAEDIAAIQTLYAPRGGTGAKPAALELILNDPGATTNSLTLNLSGSITGGVAPVTLTWRTDATASGTAAGSTSWSIQNIPLHTGMNEVTVTASDSQPSSVTKTLSLNYVSSPPAAPSGPVLQITSPSAGGTYATSAASVALSGTASYAGGITQVTWTTSTGASGVAEGTGNWNCGPISLTGATTAIEVTAWGLDGKSATQSLDVQYNAPPVRGSGSAAPSLTVVDPAGVTLAVTDSSLAVSGTAASGSGITEITWSTSNGDSGLASGTTQWSIATIPLFTGSNTIVIRAFDSSGASSWRSLVVTRY